MKQIYLTALTILTYFIMPTGCNADVTLGLLSELTGSSAPNGIACREGYETARKVFAPGDKVGSHSIRFFFGDHKAEGKTAISEYQRLTKQEGAVAIISNRGNVGVALTPLSKVDQIPLVGMMAHRDFTEGNPYAFRIWPSGKQEGSLLAQRAIKLGHKRAAMLILEDDAALGIADGFEMQLKKLGGEVVYRDLLTDSEINYSTVLLRARESKPELLYVHLSVNQIGVAVKRAREIGIKVPVFSYFWLGYADVLNSVGKDDVEGSTFLSIDTRKEKFLEALNIVAHHQSPSAVTYACYTGLAFVLRALETFNSEPTKKELYEKLSSSDSLILQDETLQFKQREIIFPLKFKVVQAGVPVYQEENL